MDIRKTIILHLSLIQGVGPATIEKLISLLPSDFDMKDLYTLSSSDFRSFGVALSSALKIVDGLKDSALLERELLLAERHQVQLLSVYDDEYPLLLKAIHLPPPILYVQGNLPQEGDYFACVGSRNAGAYAKRVVDLLIPELVAHKISITSGGAQGVDTLCHEKALAFGGTTVAVLGSGLLKLYPHTNKKLFEKIREQGALVSPFSLETDPFPGNFPARNRIISGLSFGCLVVQAQQKSGALITADYALEQGRAIYAVPGPIDDPLSAGCHQLIMQGAQLVTSAQDILGDRAVSADRKIIAPSEQGILPLYSEIEIACREPKTLDELCELIKCGETELQDKLFSLQLEGKIEQNFAGLWHSL